MREFTALRRFFAGEAAGGRLIGLAALAALIVANSPLGDRYQALWALRFGVHLGPLVIDKVLLHWINDGLMAVFFLLVGLEIKREIVDGELSSVDRLLPPVVAAVGGMLVPAIIYVAINRGDAQALRGWAIPTATDIAGSLAVLSLFGARVPLALKVFLTAVAIVDDVAAIVVIALFYTTDLSGAMLGLAAVCVVALAIANACGVRRSGVYLLIGAALWF